MRCLVSELFILSLFVYHKFCDNYLSRVKIYLASRYDKKRVTVGQRPLLTSWPLSTDQDSVAKLMLDHTASHTGWGSSRHRGQSLFGTTPLGPRDMRDEILWSNGGCFLLKVPSQDATKSEQEIDEPRAFRHTGEFFLLLSNSNSNQ